MISKWWLILAGVVILVMAIGWIWTALRKRPAPPRQYKDEADRETHDIFKDAEKDIAEADKATEDKHTEIDKVNEDTIPDEAERLKRLADMANSEENQ